nr:integrase domain-containing protein [uncultured Sulfurimonas sp.]
MSNANGIGSSKIDSRNNSNQTGENGHKVSDKAHSVKEVQNLRSVTNQYINHVKENYEGKVASNINADSAKSFLEAKSQSVSGGTLNTYSSLMNKVADNLNKDNIGSLNRADIQSIKNELKERVELKSEHINRAYNNPHAIKAEMQNSTMSISADLQHEAGLRANDAIDSSKWTINPNNTITINGSKGGNDYTTRELSQNTIDKAQSAINANYKANYTEYKEALKEAVEATGQTWDKNGTHGLRYDFAQERVQELIKDGKTQDEANGQTSLEMGHSRLDITNHYTDH